MLSVLLRSFNKLDEFFLQSKPYVEKYGYLNFVQYDEIQHQKFDYVFFSPPSHISRAKQISLSKAGIFNIVQNVRHANPYWHEGRAYRNLKEKEISRITITAGVHNAIRKLCSNMPFYVPHGFDSEFFQNRTANSTFHENRKVNIGYVDFKPVFFDDKKLSERYDNINFLKCPKNISWDKLKQFYNSIDIFISTPLAEEGLYLPGLEAMSTGAIVLSPLLPAMDHYLAKGNFVEYEYENFESLLQKIDIALEILTNNEMLTKIKKNVAKKIAMQSLDIEFAYLKRMIFS